MSPSDPVGGSCDAGQKVAPVERDSGSDEAEVLDSNGPDSDGNSEHTFSNTVSVLAGAAEEPADAMPGASGVEAEAAPRSERPPPERAHATEDPGSSLPSTAGSVVTSQEPTTPEDTSESASSVNEPARQIPRGANMRTRLLERAAAARRRPEPRGLSAKSEDALEAVGRPELSARSFELDALDPVTPRPPSAPSALRPRGQLSPNLIAAFGALLGLATIATLVAVAMRIETTPWLGLAASVEAQPPPAPTTAKPTKAEAPASKKRQRQKLPGPWRIRDVKGQSGGRIVEGKVGREPFLRAIQQAGVQKRQAYRVLTAFKGVKDLESCKRTDSFVALIDSASSRLKAFEYIVTPEEVYQVREGDDGLLRGKRLDLQIRRDRVQGAFVIDGSGVGAAAELGGFESALANALGEALEGHMSLAELERGDRVRVVAQEVTVLGEFSRYAGIEAVEIKRAEAKTDPLRVYYFRGSKSRGHYDDHGRAPYEGGWRLPVKGAPITSPFNMKRLHPILKRIMPHTGIDLGAEMGTPVGATSFGTVSYVGFVGATGNLVKIEHPNKYESGYAHLSRFAENLKVGDKVRRMQVIGYIGSTGRSTGPHLHFTIKKNGKFIDPQSLNLDGMRVLPQDERPEFDKARESYIALLQAIPWPEPLPKTESPSDLQASSTAPASSETRAGSEEMVGGGMEEETASADFAEETGTPAASEAARPASPTSKGTPTGTQAVYLTDKELMEKQGLSDDGEVEE